MSRTTQWVRDAWTPACKANPVSTKNAYIALDRCFRKHNYRPRAGVCGAYNCRRITGGSGYSLHAYDPGDRFTFWTGVSVWMAVACDINWDRNPYGKRLVTDMTKAMIDDILAIRTVTGLQVWRWGGYYSNNKDAMHFELIVSPAELARGIDWSTVPGTDEEDEMTDADWTRLEAYIHREIGLLAAALLAKDDDKAQAGGSHFDVPRGDSLMDVTIAARNSARKAAENTATPPAPPAAPVDAGDPNPDEPSNPNDG